MAEILEFNEMFYTNFEPKMQNRFIMEVDGIPSYLIKAADRPNLSFDQVELHHINVKRKLKGKANWEDITITLHDPIVPSGAQAVMEWIRLSHESITGRDGYADFYKKDVNFYLLGPVGDKVEEWTIKGAFINNMDTGNFDWSNTTDPAEITLSLSYDYAILEY